MGKVFRAAAKVESSVSTHRTEVKKCVNVWGVLILIAFFVVTAWTVILNSNFNCQRFLSADDSWVVWAGYPAFKVERLAGEDRRWKIWNLLLTQPLYSSNKYSPSSEEVSAGDRTEVLDLCSKNEGVCFFSFRPTHDWLASWLFPDRSDIHFIHADVGSIGSIESISRYLKVPTSNSSVHEQKEQCRAFNFEFSLFKGKFLLLEGVFLLVLGCGIVTHGWRLVCFDENRGRLGLFITFGGGAVICLDTSLIIYFIPPGWGG